MGSILGPKRVIDKDVEGYTYFLLCQIHDISSLSRGGMVWPKTEATHCHAQLGHPYKGCAIKVMFVCIGPAYRSGPRLLSTIA